MFRLLNSAVFIRKAIRLKARRCSFLQLYGTWAVQTCSSWGTCSDEEEIDGYQNFKFEKSASSSAFTTLNFDVEVLEP